MDRARYLPKSWCDDPDGCDGAGIPSGQWVFATKPALARDLIERAVHAQVPAIWVTAD
jgi:SRSO17 transposase